MSALAGRELLIVATVYVDHALMTTLEAHFDGVDQQVRKRVIGSYLRGVKARVDGTYALGLIGPRAHSNLLALVEARNIAAHRYSEVDVEAVAESLPFWLDPAESGAAFGGSVDTPGDGSGFYHASGTWLSVRDRLIVTDSNDRVGFWVPTRDPGDVADPDEHLRIALWALIYAAIVPAVVYWRNREHQAAGA